MKKSLVLGGGLLLVLVLGGALALAYYPLDLSGLQGRFERDGMGMVVEEEDEDPRAAVRERTEDLDVDGKVNIRVKEIRQSQSPFPDYGKWEVVWEVLNLDSGSPSPLLSIDKTLTRNGDESVLEEHRDMLYATNDPREYVWVLDYQPEGNSGEETLRAEVSIAYGDDLEMSLKDNVLTQKIKWDLPNLGVKDVWAVETNGIPGLSAGDEVYVLAANTGGDASDFFRNAGQDLMLRVLTSNPSHAPRWSQSVNKLLKKGSQEVYLLDYSYFQGTAFSDPAAKVCLESAVEIGVRNASPALGCYRVPALGLPVRDANYKPTR